MTTHAVIEQARSQCGALVFFPRAEPWNNPNTSEEQATGFVLDFTEQKLSDDGRETLMQGAHTNRLATMGQLTTSIAHEVSQPLGATMANAQAALRWLGAEQPNLAEVREALGRIVRDVSRASQVVRQIRNLSKKAPPREDRLDLKSAIREVIDMTQMEAIQSGVSVGTDLPESLPLIQGNQVELQQVILNLIINAIEAMREMSNGAREIWISATTTDSGEVLVSVRDTGPGLAPATLKSLFEAFHTTKAAGLGLGLSICRTIIEAHGGRLWAKADVPRGAIFQFALPALRQSMGMKPMAT